MTTWTIRRKLTVLLIGAFAVLALVVNLIALFEVGRVRTEISTVVDTQINDVFTARLKAMVAECALSADQLAAPDAKEDAAAELLRQTQRAVVARLRAQWYTGDAEVYPFIIDGRGVAVMHPIDKEGVKHYRDESWYPQFQQTTDGSFPYTYNDEAKWMRVIHFEPWDWRLGFALSQVVRNAPFRALDTSLTSFQRLLMFGIVAVALLVLLLAGLVITYTVVRPIRTLVTRLTATSAAINRASDQLSTASDDIADGANRQAAGLEQVSATVSELSQVTETNASKAGQANGEVNQATAETDRGRSSMERMIGAINSIKSSSDKTATILKTIDEIAFQTNLLALNAAVEAARAGDAGRGFAVVAEEVRNLAGRSADAARETAHLIEEVRTASDNGVEVTDELSAVLDGIVDRVGNVAGLIDEVASASRQQAEAIGAVTRTIRDMESVTQANAANAEQTAASSGGLRGQANELQAVVDELNAMAGAQATRTPPSRRPPAQTAPPRSPARSLPAPAAAPPSAATTRPPPRRNETTAPPPRVTDPADELLPMPPEPASDHDPDHQDDSRTLSRF